MSDKTIQERLRYAGAINDDADCFWVDSDLLREAADLIDRLTAPAREDQVERVADALFNSGACSIGYRGDARLYQCRIHARAAIAAMPSEETIRRDEREKCAQVAERLGPHWHGVPAAIRARSEEK